MPSASLYPASQAFQQLAKDSTTLVLPANTSDPSAMVAQAMGIYKTMAAAPAPPAASSSSRSTSTSGNGTAVLPRPGMPFSTLQRLASNAGECHLPTGLLSSWLRSVGLQDNYAC